MNFAIDRSLTDSFLSRFSAQQILDPLSYVLYLKDRRDFRFTFLSFPSIDLTSLSPKTLFHTQISSPTWFLAYIKLKSLGKLPKFLHLHAFMHFRPRFWFFEKFWGFWDFCEMFGLRVDARPQLGWWKKPLLPWAFVQPPTMVTTPAHAGLVKGPFRWWCMFAWSFGCSLSQWRRVLVYL